MFNRNTNIIFYLQVFTIGLHYITTFGVILSFFWVWGWVRLHCPHNVLGNSKTQNWCPRLLYSHWIWLGFFHKPPHFLGKVHCAFTGWDSGLLTLIARLDFIGTFHDLKDWLLLKSNYVLQQDHFLCWNVWRKHFKWTRRVKGVSTFDGDYFWHLLQKVFNIIPSFKAMSPIRGN